MVDLKRYKALIIASLFALTALTSGSYCEGSPSSLLKKGTLIVARPQLASKLFRESVILIVIHEKKGTLGLIINKPSGHSPSAILAIPEDMGNLHEDLFFGGPVNKHIPTLLIDTDNPPEGADKVFGSIYFSGNAAGGLIDGKSKSHYEIRAYSGISSWARGQLEMEIMRGDWLILEPDLETVFSKEPEELWKKLLKKKERGSGFLLEVNNKHSN